ncbi:MAG: BON domain-containing protein [Planctomycetaceae bacterium]
MSDEHLTHGVRELLKLRHIPGLDVADVWAEEGVVHVRGAAHSDFAKRTCYECCRHVTGVRGVVDEVHLMG